MLINSCRQPGLSPRDVTYQSSMRSLKDYAYMWTGWHTPAYQTRSFSFCCHTMLCVSAAYAVMQCPSCLSVCPDP